MAVVLKRDGRGPERPTSDIAPVLYEDGQLRIVQVRPPDTVQLDGDVDITNSLAVADVFTRVAECCGRVVVDTTGLRFIDVSGWRVLIDPGPGAGPARVRPRLLNVAPCVERLTKRLTTS